MDSPNDISNIHNENMIAAKRLLKCKPNIEFSVTSQLISFKWYNSLLPTMQ
jgi:hypothetical protein